MPAPVAYFGPANTNTHAAARKVFGAERSYVPCNTKTAVFEAVENGGCEVGIVPIENSTEGVVRETIDCLIARPLMIQREYEMSIRHCLMGRKDTSIELARKIYSHPQPLAQCRKWLDERFPEYERLTAVSTASAAKMAADDPSILAIATRLAAESFDLEIFADDVADRKDNATRFICVAKEDSAPTGRDKTTLVFTTPHEQGALIRILSVFDQAGVNMARIESRPRAERRWEYTFVVDLEGHRAEAPVKAALEAMKKLGCDHKVVGSYPRSEHSVAPP